MPPQKWVTKYERKPGRWVFEPTAEYRVIGEGIRKAVQKVWRPPPYYFHLRKGGHVAALRRHAQKTYFARFDIEDFFGRVNQNRVARCLKEYFGSEVARQMALNSTVRHPTVPGRWVLPYGFIQSPILASLALSKSRLGSALRQLDKASGINVSVYVDDIIVSCDDSDKLQQAREVLAAAAVKSRLAFNAAKCQGPASAITAFNIELTHGNLEIEAERLAEFAAMLAATPSAQREQGIVGYVNSVNTAQAVALKPTTP
jgi:hypothetical protein